MTAQTEPTQDAFRTDEHMDLVEDGHTICDECGNYYNHRAVEMPENASFYWVPGCPNCGAAMTTNPTTQFGLELTGSDLDSTDDNYEDRRENLHARARLFHGRLVGYSADELVRRAKWFDRKSKTGTAYGPRFYRGIAFRLRKQARQQVNE